MTVNPFQHPSPTTSPSSATGVDAWGGQKATGRRFRDRPSGWLILLGFAGALLFPIVPLGVMFAFMLAGSGESATTVTEESLRADLTTGAPLAFSQIALWCGMLLPVWLAGRAVRGGWRNLVQWRIHWKRDLLIAAGFIGGFTALEIAVLQGLTAAGVNTDNLGNTSPITSQTGVWLVFMVIGAVLIAPVVEELFFRGVFFVTCLRAWSHRTPPRQPSRAGAIAAIMVSSVGFGLLHVQETFAASVFTVSATTLLGVGLAVIYYRTQRFGPVALSHIGFNAVGVTLAFLAGVS